MYKKKTKIINNIGKDRKISIETKLLAKIVNYIYLDQKLTTKRDKMSGQITRRIRLRSFFGKLNYILKERNILNTLKTKVYNQCIISVINYGAEIWNVILV